MLDIKFIRENAAVLKDVAAKKNLDPAIIDKLLEVDKARRERIQAAEGFRAKQKTTKDHEEAKKLKEQFKSEEEELKKIREQKYRDYLKESRIRETSPSIGKANK